MSDFAQLQEAARAAGVQVSRPTNVDIPMVSGVGTIGEVLNCTMGNWTGEPTAYTYQWMGNGDPIAAAVAADYTIVAGDAGRALTCVVTATNNVGSTAAPASNAVVVAAAAAAAAAHPAAAHPAAHPADAHPQSRENPGAAAGERNRR